MNEWIMVIGIIVGSLTGLASIQLLQHNWYKREKLKFGFDVKRAKLRKKDLPVKKTSTPTTPMDWLGELKKINPETLHELIDQFGGGGDEQGGDLTEILGNIVKTNPELVQKFIGNLGKDNKLEDTKYL